MIKYNKNANYFRCLNHAVKIAQVRLVPMSHHELISTSLKIMIIREIVRPENKARIFDADGGNYAVLISDSQHQSDIAGASV